MAKHQEIQYKVNMAENPLVHQKMVGFAQRPLTPNQPKDMRKVAVSHMEGGHNILSFVESRGEDALARRGAGGHKSLGEVYVGDCGRLLPSMVSAGGFDVAMGQGYLNKKHF